MSAEGTLKYRLEMLAVVVCLIAAMAAAQERPSTPDGLPGSGSHGLLMEPTELPDTYVHAQYQVQFHGRGDYVPTLRWKLQSGALPPGIQFDESGGLRGEPQKAGEFSFVISVRDGGQPEQAYQKGYVLKVVDGIALAWKKQAKVSGSRIDGSVEVTNATADDVDLTFDVKAIADNGRATEIGYQHFVLKRGTVAMALPFGETLPHGAYQIDVNVVGEVAKHNAIYRQEMKTDSTLAVVAGP